MTFLMDMDVFCVLYILQFNYIDEVENFVIQAMLVLNLVST